MVSLSERRQAHSYICRVHKVSQRRACKVLSIDRKSLRYRAKRRSVDTGLRQLIVELSRAKPRYGYRKIAKKVKDKGHVISRERVRIIRKEEGVKVLKIIKKKRFVGNRQNSLKQATRINQVWSYDFIYDRTESGFTIKFLNIMDEFSKECLAIVAARRITSERVIKELQRLFAERGVPDYIRSDNGPEFVAQRIRKFLAEQNTNTLFIEPGQPWQNPYIESFNSIFRQEFLDANLFYSFKAAQLGADHYKTEYNFDRPHGVLDDLTPAEFAAINVQKTTRQTA